MSTFSIFLLCHCLEVKWEYFFRNMLYCQCGTSSMGTVNKKS